MTSNWDWAATAAQPLQPTAHAEVNAAIGELLAGARGVLGDHLRGMYLHGSLALGDFAPHRSDLDVLFVTDADLQDELMAGLRAMHARFAEGDSPWATEVEVSYIPRDALRWYDPAHARHPRINRGSGDLTLEQHEIDWVIQRHVLRERGVALVGPPPRTLIDPIEPDELRLAMVTSVRRWWAPMGHDATRLRHRGYQAYAVLTMCRILYTLEMGTVVSKPAAARWALHTLDGQWAPLIKRALAWRKERQKPLGTDVEETMRLIRYVAERCRRWEDTALHDACAPE